MKIALAQMEVIPNQPKKNLENMLRMIEEAKEKKADLIAFPEMCIGGYLLGDLWSSDDFCRDLMSYNEDIRNASEGIAIAFGNIYLDDKINERVNDDKSHPNKDGRIRRYNAIYVVQNKKYAKKANETEYLPEGVHAKTLLPNYRIFDDERYFFSLQDIAKDFGKNLDELSHPFLIDIDGKKVPIGFELCEDLWCADYRKDGNAINPTKYLIKNGAEKIVNISASPWTYGKNSARDRRVKFLKEESNDDFVEFLYVNCTGCQNNGKNIVTFDGGSTVYNREGLPIQFSKSAYEEELIIAENFNLPSLKRKETPKVAQKLDAIVKGIKCVKNMLGFSNDPGYVIGLSGGIDSSVVAALLVLAAGKENVFGINMPTKYNSNKTKQAAEKVAQELGILYEVIPIGDLVDLNENMLENIAMDENSKLSELNKENIQAKIRGTSILSNLASKYNALFTNNGNKLEVALGYATLYGDVGGAFAPIADLTKTEVVELAKYLNETVFKREVIPKILIPDELFRFTKDQIIPSAELKNNQIDPMKFGYHCALLEAMTDYRKKSAADIMRWYIDGTLETNLGVSNAMIKRWNIDKPEEFVKDLEWFTSTIQRNVFKRVQSPPIIITSKSAYGYDIRESILPYCTGRIFEDLKQKVLAMPSYSKIG